MPPKGPPPPPRANLRAMNQNAAQNAPGASKGALPCKGKEYFAIQVIEVVDKKETYLSGVTIDLTLSTGNAQRVTDGKKDPIRCEKLPPGSGTVRQMTHGSAVYDAIGDFS